MKKVKILIMVFLSLFIFSCSNAGNEFSKSFLGEKIFNLTEKEKFLNKMQTYKLEAKIKTNKGDINVYLYPESSPKLVANFVYLSKIGYYKDVKFHRVSVNNIIQSGDRRGDGTGYPGYLLEDEFGFLKFDRAGILAMANMGPNTNGSQFFITLQKIDAYNDKYSILGNTKTIDDTSVARLIRQDDVILDVEITGYNVDKFLEHFKDDIKVWEESLEKIGFKVKK